MLVMNRTILLMAIFLTVLSLDSVAVGKRTADDEDGIVPENVVITKPLAVQTVDGMFVNIPDSIFPYLTKEQRQELVNLRKVDGSTPAILHSAFNCDVAMTYMDFKRLTVEIDSAVIVEIARLFVPEGDSVYCVLSTVATPEKDTQAYIYDKDWNKIGDVSFYDAGLFQRPDTMNENTFEELNKLIEFPLVEAHFIDDATMTVILNVPLVSKEDRKRLIAILTERKLRWNGSSFQPSF